MSNIYFRSQGEELSDLCFLVVEGFSDQICLVSDHTLLSLWNLDMCVLLVILWCSCLLPMSTSAVLSLPPKRSKKCHPIPLN